MHVYVLTYVSLEILCSLTSHLCSPQKIIEMFTNNDLCCLACMFTFHCPFTYVANMKSMLLEQYLICHLV